MTIRKSDQSLKRDRPFTFTAITAFGVVALLLGLGLIIFAHYHERAYVFLGLGAAGVIGGIAGIVSTGSRLKAALRYGVIAMGIMGIVVGFNYLADLYGPAPSQRHGVIVIALSIVAIVAGIVWTLFTEGKDGIAAFARVILLGVVASAGIVALTAGTIYLVVLEKQGGAYFLFGIGAVCLIAGIACDIFLQTKQRESKN